MGENSRRHPAGSRKTEAGTSKWRSRRERERDRGGVYKDRGGAYKERGGAYQNSKRLKVDETIAESPSTLHWPSEVTSPFSRDNPGDETKNRGSEDATPSSTKRS